MTETNRKEFSGATISSGSEKGLGGRVWSEEEPSPSADETGGSGKANKVEIQTRTK